MLTEFSFILVIVWGLYWVVCDREVSKRADFALVRCSEILLSFWDSVLLCCSHTEIVNKLKVLAYH